MKRLVASWQPGRRYRVPLWLTIGLVLINGFILLLSALALQSSYDQFQSRAEVASQNLSSSIAQSVAAEMSFADLGLIHLADAATHLREREKLWPGGIVEEIEHEMGGMPQGLGYRVTDEAGRVLWGNGYVAGPVPASVADRPYFIAARSADGLVFSDPLQGRTYKEWVVVLARRYLTPDGRFGGVVYCGLAINRLNVMFANFQLTPDDAIALRGSDLGVISRYPAQANGEMATGNKQVSQALRDMVARFPLGGTYRAAAGIDQIPRILSYRKVGPYPFLVIVGLAEQGYLAQWRQEVEKIGGLALAFFLVTVGSAGLFYLSWRRGRLTEELLHLTRFAVDHAAEAILLVSPEGRILHGNRAAVQCLGWSPDSSLGGDSTENLGRSPEGGWSGVLKEMEEGLTDSLWQIRWSHLVRGEPLSYRALMRSAGSTDLWPVEVTANHFSYDGRDHAILILSDMSERLRHESELHEALDRTRALASTLAKKNRNLEEFAEVLAHHLQEPVRLQMSFAQRLQKLLLAPEAPPLSEAAAQALAFILQGSERLRRLLRDVQAFVAVDQARGLGEPGDTGLALADALLKLKQKIEQTGARVETQESYPTVGLDARSLSKLFQYLIDNAIEYRQSDVPPMVAVTALVEGNEVLFTVEDNGIGIPLEYRERVFRIFERLHGERSRTGTGIGLALVKKTVEDVGGRVWIEDGRQGGTRVRFALPAKEG